MNRNEKQMENFTENYFEKLFFFCLKKTGDSYEAEELASDITLNIVTALQKGTVPISFSGWVWQIARNRYSAWAERRRRVRESDSGADISDIELADEKIDLEKAWLHNEDLKLLRRELAFAASDYRNVVVAYYIEDRSVKDIGNALGLPEGTVKSKLFRARELLKEGMSMAREFGVMSYRPENVEFSCCCDSFGYLGEPWSYLNRLLCKNILLAAYKTPSTSEELSVEVGVALPYMEDELRQLTEATLLRKNGKKYETSFFIFSAQVQEKIDSFFRGLAPQLTEAVIAAMEYKIKCLEENGVQWHEGYQAYEDMKWALLMQEVDAVERAAHAAANGSRKEPEYTDRPNGGKWDIVGYEKHKDMIKSIGHHCGCGEDTGCRKLIEDGIKFGHFRFSYHDMNQMTPDWVSYRQVETLVKLAKGKTEELSEDILQELQKMGYLRKTDQGYEPAIMVTVQDKLRPLTEQQEAGYQELLEKAVQVILRLYEFGRKVMCEEVPEFLRQDFHQIDFALSCVLHYREIVLEEAVRTGYLTDDTEARSVLGAHLTI